MCTLLFLYKQTKFDLGSGIPRILEVYGKKCFSFSENFLRMILPNTPQVTDQVTDQVRKLLIAMDSNSLSAAEIMTKLKLNHRPSFRESYLKPALELKLIEMTIPDKPNSSLQKYRRVG
jgi:hypothetical protein